ncbi:MAG: hypothetical protein Q9181_007083 [Wetmoreana brouardii]
MLLAPGNGPDPLACSLAIVDIEKAPPFEALSYVWGRDIASQPIWCDGGFIQIKSNLDTALRSLRLPSHARRLWVDALCIDQGNIDERSRQVQYMRIIYKHAARTIVWLGPRSQGIEEAFHLADMVAEVKQASSGTSSLIGTKGTGDALELDLIADIFNANEEIVGRLIDLFDRDYFVRIWCVQEVVVSRSCVAKCEHLEINLMDLLSSVIHVSFRRKSFLPRKPLEFWNMIYLLKQPGHSNLPAPSGHRVEASVGPLLSLLGGTRNFQATDPRDKIFSLLGISDEGLMPVSSLTKVMATDDNSLSMRFLRHAQSGLASLTERVNRLGPGVDFGKNKALQTDYNKDMMEVYRDLTRFMMRKSPRMLDVLSHVQHLDEPPNDAFPTWVPKWFQSPSTSILGGTGIFLAGLCDGHFPYFAILHDCPLTGQPIRPNVLLVDGYFVDRVVRLSEFLDFGVLDCPPVEGSWAQLFGTSFFPLSSRTYRNGEFLQMALCKTLLAGCLGPVAASLASTSGVPEGDLHIKYSQQGHSDAAAYLMQYGDDGSSLSTVELTAINQSASAGDIDRYGQCAQVLSYNRRIYLTQNGFLGLGPRMMREGDEICVLFGGRLPFILRRMRDHHIFIGDTYIHDDDIMWGKLTERVRFRNQLPIVTYEIR